MKHLTNPNCLNKIGFQFIQSNLDLSNVSKIHISVAMFAVDTNFTATTFERATFTIEPYDGDEIVISSNPPNLYKIKFFGGDGYKVTDDDNDGFVYEEDTTTLAFERINQAEVKSVSKIRLVIQFPRYQLLDLYVNTDKSTVNVLPGFNNLKSIQTIIGVKLNAQLTAPVTNFTLDNGVYHSNESQLGNSTFFTVETDKNSTTSNHSVILLNYNPQIFIGEPQESSRLYNLAIRGTITTGATSKYFLDPWQKYHIFVEGAVTNFDLYVGDITIHDFSGCNGVNLVMLYNTTSEYEMLMNPSCQQINGGITTSSPTDGNKTSVIPDQ